jgi:low affinity Fe/Cu permease
MLKLALKGAIVIASSLIVGFVGLVIGAYIGGNFAETFTFNRVRGYEATGQLVFLVGITIGITLSIFLLFKHSRRKSS